MGCGGSSEEAEGPAAPPEAPTEEVPRSVAPVAGICLPTHDGPPTPLTIPVIDGTCKFGCGRLVAVSDTGRKFDTCCKSCATSAAHDQHDENCRGFPEGRLYCPKGAKCRNRTAEHLSKWAHPLDPDYDQVCEVYGVERDPLSLRQVFDWMDADGSGKLSRQELTEGIRLVGDLRGDDPEDRAVINDKAWQALDEDGNGVVNFTEFACWAGPRWGLPLGLKRRGSNQENMVGRKCTVIGCPCADFCPCDPPKEHKCSFCKHKVNKHKQVEDSEVDFPAYWDNHDSTVRNYVELKSSHVKEFQTLLDTCYKNSWTRDRSRHNPDNPRVPRGYQVLKAYRNENGKLWGEYFARLTDLQHEASEALAGQREEGPFKIWHQEVRTTVAAAQFQQGDTLSHECNEWYLLHGTNPTAAKAICSTDFVIRTAGSNTGTLYGRGLYFADSITKADEYSKPNDSGVYAVLLCRVLGGRVLYTDAVTPDAEDLVQKCVGGSYDTVLGDREKCKGTFKEFVLFDTEDVFPEYVIEYKRLY